MPFDPNREITIQANQLPDDSYRLRTAGLAKKALPELEVVSIPEAALHAAGGILNLVAAFTVDEGKVLAGQTVGNVLTVGDEGREMLLALRAVEAEPPKRPGLWARLGGDTGTHGVLRLLDVEARDDEHGPPLTALSTMLVHRALVRLAKADHEAARVELETSLALHPGDPAHAARAPEVDGVTGILNWQNHLTYVELAELALADDDLEGAVRRLHEAAARSTGHALRVFGASLDALVGLDASVIEAHARHVITQNLQEPPTAGADEDTLAVVVARSPVWEALGDATRRRSAIVPPAFLSLYYEGTVASALRERGPSLVARAFAGATRESWVRALLASRRAVGVWVTPAAPPLADVPDAVALHRALSRVLVEVARCLRAGLGDEAVLARLRYEPHAEGDALLARHDDWESAEMLKAMTP